MALTAGSAAVGTAATRLVHGDRNPSTIHIHNLDNTDTVFIGGETVTPNNGASIPKSSETNFSVPPGVGIYAVSSKSGHSVSYLHITI